MAKKGVSMSWRKSEIFAVSFFIVVAMLAIVSFFGDDFSIKIFNNPLLTILVNVLLFVLFMGYVYYRFIND